MRIALRIAIALLLLFAVVLAAAWIWRAPLVEAAARRAVAQAGYPDAQFTLQSVETGRAVITDLALGPDAPRADRIDLRYGLLDLLSGRVDAIEISGAAVRIDLSPDSRDAGTGATDEPAVLPPLVLPRVLTGLGAQIAVTDAMIEVLGTPLGDADLTVNAALDLSRKPAPLTLSAAGAGRNGGGLENLTFEGSGTAGRSRVLLDGTAATTINDVTLAGITASSLTYDGPLTIESDTDDLTLSLTDPVRATLVMSGEAGGTRTSDPMRMLSRAGPAQVRLATGGPLAGTLTVEDGELAVPSRNLRVRRTRLTLPFTADGLGQRTLVSARLDQTGDGAVLAPLAVRATITREDDALVLNGMVAADEPGALVPVRARYETATGAATGRFGPGTLVFRPGDLQPEHLSPLLRPLTNAQGSLRAEGTVNRTPAGQLTSNATLTFDDLDLTSTVGRIESLNGVIRLTDLTDPRTPPSQNLTARRLRGALSLDNPRLRFELVRTGGDPEIRIEQAGGGLAGGQVALDAATVRPLAGSNALTVRVADLSLETLLTQYAAGQVSGTGRLSGALPMRAGSDGLVLTDGRLIAQDPGTIQVSWGGVRPTLMAQGEQVALLVRALEDFRYTRLEIGIDRPADGALSLSIRLEGSNPAVMDNQPFIFNIALTGNLEELLAAMSAGTGVTMDLLRGSLASGR